MRVVRFEEDLASEYRDTAIKTATSVPNHIRQHGTAEAPNLAAAPRIQQQAVTTQAMPIGNLTKMTNEERALVGKWLADGASTN